MQIGGRLQGAIDILKEIETNHKPASIALKEWGNAHRFAGVKDRAAIGNIVYDTLRRMTFLKWCMGSEDSAAAAYAAVAYLNTLNVLNGNATALVDLEKNLENCKFINFSLSKEHKSSWQAHCNKDPDESIKANMPSWCIESFKNYFGEGWQEEAAALTERPPLDLRINFLKATAPKVLKTIEQAKQIPWFNQGLRIAPTKQWERHPNVQAEPSFQKGWFEIQDLGSQIIAFLAFHYAYDHLEETKKGGSGRGFQVLDYCSGAGGKTLSIASLLENKGQIYAYDLHKVRLAPIFERMRRAGVRNCQASANKQHIEALKGKMSLVLCDAPCTGSGTWRRHPDTKWKLTEKQLQIRLKEQKDILDEAQHYVKLGGFFAYMTCSLFAQENDEQIKKFLEKQNKFLPIALEELWEKHMGEEAPRPIFTPYGLLLTPYQTNTDGFYLAIMQKIKD